MASSARIDELRKKFDENPRRYFAPLANEYRKAGDLEQAIFICQEYLPQQPGHMSGHIVYGQALFELSRFDESRAVFETALSLDPENLIALRHLGDIAHQAGDLKGARSWYQRVLEADPRNEEIAQLMLTVLTTPHESQAAIPSSGTDGISGVETGPGYESNAGGSPVEQAVDGSGLTVGPELSQLAERQPEPEPESIRRSPETIPDDELLDLNDFSVGDVPLSSLVSGSVEPPPAEPFVESGPAFESFSPAPEAVEAAANDMVVERSEDGPSFEPDPYAIAAAADVHESAPESDEPPPLPPEVFATDIVLGLPDDGAAPSVSDAGDSAALAGLESYSDPSFALGAASAPAMEVESFFSLPADEPPTSHADEPAAESAAEQTIEAAWTPDAPIEAREEFEEFVAAGIVEPAEAVEPPVDAVVEAAGEPEPEAFVTETMAELYLQQGHLEAALDIYQKLAEQRPGDDYLRERMLAVADAIHEASFAAAPAEAYASYDAAAYDVIDDGSDEGAVLAGPTIREFLSGILQPRIFVGAEEAIQRAVTPVSTAALADADFSDTQFGDTTVDHASLDDTPLDPSNFGQPMFSQGMAPTFDDSVFDTSAYGDAPSLGETAMYETPAFGVPAYEGTPSHGVDDFEDPPLAETGATEEFAGEAATYADSPTFEESPHEATTLEIDLSGPEFQALASHAVVPPDSQESIDEEIGADLNDWPQIGATVEAQPEASTESVQPSTEDVHSPIESVDAAAPSISRPTPSSSETVTGSIDALFSGADASTVDSTAASTLAQAFASEMPDAPPLQGMPAHRAADELSLDHVFKSNPAPRPETEGEGFSFDQFFADDMNEAAPKPGAEAASTAAPGAGSDDIAQFNNWLNGLKKT